MFPAWPRSKGYNITAHREPLCGVRGSSGCGDTHHSKIVPRIMLSHSLGSPIID